MKWYDILAFIMVFVLLGITIYFLWYNLPGEVEEFNRYNLNEYESLSSKILQFYPNMRYADRVITYSLDSVCNEKKKTDFENAAKILEQKTALDFSKSGNPGDAQIKVYCSNNAPEPEQKDHFIAGEGGPTEIINASRYAVMFAGQISLYREETCDEPKIAIHELLHALGFDHNKNENSIMYPVTDCAQEIDQGIIDEINRLYTEPSFADLLIENINANKSGRYLNFNIIMANYGLKNVYNSSLDIEADGAVIKIFSLGDFDIGTKRSLSVTDLKIPRDASEIAFEIKTKDPEINKDNNRAKIGIVKRK